MNNATRHSIVVGIFFLILFTAYGSFSTIITQIHQQDGNQSLGPSILAANYAAFMLVNIFAPSVRMKLKIQMAIGAFFYCANFSSGLLIRFLPTPLYYTLSIIGAIIAGSGSALLWTSVGGYLHLMCQTENVEAERGKYMGIFYGIYSIQNILSGLITTFCLGLLSTQTYFMIITSLGFISSLFCLLFVEDLQKQHNALNPNKYDPKESALKLFKFYPKMKHTILLVFLIGIIMAFVNSSLTHLIPHSDSDKQANRLSGICFIFFGIGSVLGGFLSGKLSDILSIKSSANVCGIIYVLTMLGSIIGYYYSNYQWLCFIFSLWGFVQNYSDGWMIVSCSRIYGGKLQSFAINKQFHSFSYVLYQIIVIITKNSIQLIYILLFMLLLVIPVFIGFCYLKPIIPKNQQSLISEDVLDPNL